MRRQQQQFEEVQQYEAPSDPLAESSYSTMQSIQSIMQKLQQLSEQIETNPQYSTQHLKEYITLYVQNHKRSQQFFNLMCQHNMLAKLFTTGVNRPIYILQTFNLLLANTQHVHELVYIFSHPLFHNYLLINVETIFQLSGSNNNNLINSSSMTSSVILASHQCIEYYIQLIKTLVTKLEAESNQCTLLKLFCNSKYSYFPLLTNCIILAIKRNIKEELVRVTAQHCILQLVGIMARKKVGECYFYNLHMLILFYEIIHQTIQEETTQSSTQDTTIKYLIDLLKAINLSSTHEAKQKSFLMFFTIFSNLTVFKFMKNPAPALHLISKLSNQLSQIDELKEMPAKYLTPVYFIFGKLLFNKYLNNVTLSSIILVSDAISELSQLKDINILKIIKNHYEKNLLTSQQIEVQKQQRNSYQQDKKKRQSFRLSEHKRKPLFSDEDKKRECLNESNHKFVNSMIKIRQVLFQQQYQSLLKDMQRYNMDNEQFFSLKQNFYKKSSQSSNNSYWLSGIGNIFKKINIFDIATAEYIKRIAHIAAVRYAPEKEIKFLDEVLSPSAVYLYEFLKIREKERYLFGQRTQDTQKIEISFNENRDEFLCSNQFFKVALNIADVAISELDILWEKSSRQQMIQKLQQKFHSRLQHLGEVYFTLHFRQYFQSSIFEFLCTSSNSKPRIELNPKLISYFYKLASFLQFQLSEMNCNKVKAEILKLQKELYSIVKEKGFEPFCEYMQGQKEKQMVGYNDRQSLQMQVSVIRFDRKDTFEESSKKLSSSNKKKKSIFRSFSKSSSGKQSPKKQLSQQNYSLKHHQTIKIVQTKMLHLQLLRFLLQTPQMNTSMKSVQQEVLPLSRIFEQKFMNKYKTLLMERKDKQLLYQMNGIGFNQEADYQCTLRIKVNYEEFAIFCELLHENKLILKCNIKEFSLSEPYIDMETEKSIMQNRLSADNHKSFKYQYLLNLLPTTNTLGFVNRGKAVELLNAVNQVKFGFRETKDSAILVYLNRDNQSEK